MVGLWTARELGAGKRRMRGTSWPRAGRGSMRGQELRVGARAAASSPLDQAREARKARDAAPSQQKAPGGQEAEFHAL